MTQEASNVGYEVMQQTVLKNKYLLKGESTLEDVAHRVALAIGEDLDADVPIRIMSPQQEAFEDLIVRRAFLPGGRVLYGAGNPDHKSSLANCYFIPIEDDSIEGIFKCAQQAARTMAAGGGVGIDLGILRPAGARVNNAAEKSSGVPGWMELFSLVGSTIGQHGRDGALILTLPINHPDIEGFITAKRNNDKITSANISVKVTDEFMQAVVDDGEIELHHPSYGPTCIRVPARRIWNILVDSAYRYAEPGILFWDTIKKQSPSEWCEMDLEGVNPCGEQPLEPWGSCNLGSLNLANYADDDRDFTQLRKDVRTAVQFLNRVIDINKHPLKEQDEANHRSRRIGLGVTGLAHYLVKRGVKYGSPESLQEIHKIMDIILNIAYQESACLASKDKPYPYWSWPAWSNVKAPWKSHLWAETVDLIEKYGLRNCALLTCPPVGSGSLILGTSTGIEPIFSTHFTRYLKDRDGSGEEIKHEVYDPLYHEYLTTGRSLDLFVTAHDINPMDRITVQSTLQEYVDSAISSTINLGPEVTQEQVSEIFMEAWRKGLKGVTIFREGGERRGVYVTKKEEELTKAVATPATAVTPPPTKLVRPKVVDAKTVKIKTPDGSCFVSMGLVEDKPIEVFAILGKSGANEKANAEAIGRLISIYLQDGGTIERVIEVLEGIRGADMVFDKGYRIDSLPDAIAKALRIATQPPEVPEVTGKPCPSCEKGTMVRYGGCMKCDRCEYSACG